ncbi:hypothetical protein LCGC14_2418490 [marine sediment metagenome]|uniref:Uncharacterized protein n=1 Tax=marine sediment metagenome TaxID=412755 RepID=A0A0F9E2I1_9ZZZZ
MTKTELYLEASRQLAEGEQTYSCLAISRLTPDWILTLTHETPEVKAYCEVFNTDILFRDFTFHVDQDEDPRNLRVMMTSLMAYCWEDFQ